MLYDRIRDLPVRIDGFTLRQSSLPVSSGFERITTVIEMSGGGLLGSGEDVTYEPEPHHEIATSPPTLPLDAATTVGEASQILDPIGLGYRRFGFESAVLDLALRQAGRSLGDLLDRPYRPLRFVVSTRLDPLAWLAANPDLEFKLDPVPDWDRAHLERLAGTGRVRCLDFKAHYHGTAVDNPPDLRLYRECAELFPTAVLEDSSFAPEAIAALGAGVDRLSFDAPIHAVADIEALPVRPAAINIKPSRFATWERLFAAIEWCTDEGIALYGGGQFELSVGRSHVQALASLFYADAANDVAPADYNVGDPRTGLPTSPLRPADEQYGVALAVLQEGP